MYPTKKLSEICEILDRLRKPVTASDRTSGPYPYYGATGIQDYVDKYIFDEDLILVGEDGAKWGKGENTAFKISGKTWVNNHAHVLRLDKNQIEDNWIIYFLNYSDLSQYISGATVQKLNQERLRGIQIPLPPLSTQSKIVAKLDEAFGNIDRQISLLKANIEDMESMKKNVLEEYFRKEGAERRLMKNVLTICEYGSSKKSTDNNSGVPVLRMGNIQNGGVILNDLKYTSKDTEDLPKLYLKKYDLLFNRTNSWELVGKTGIFLGEDNTISFAGYLIRLRFSPDISPIYANYYFNSEYFRKTQIEPQIDQQCGQANFSGGKLKETEFLYYPLPRQHEIVEHLDRIFTQTAELRSSYEAQIRDLEMLRQSLLEEAFAGRLVSE